MASPFSYGVNDGRENPLQTASKAPSSDLSVQFDQLIRSNAEDEVWVQIPVTRSKRKRTPYEASHKDVYQIVGVDVLGDPQQTNFGRDIVFSADLCYNDIGDKNG